MRHSLPSTETYSQRPPCCEHFFTIIINNNNTNNNGLLTAYLQSSSTSVKTYLMYIKTIYVSYTLRIVTSLDNAKTLVHALVTSKVDHFNAVLYGLPKYKIERLQYVLNSAARLATLTHKHDHITPVSMELHWLPVEQRVECDSVIHPQGCAWSGTRLLKGTFRIL